MDAFLELFEGLPQQGPGSNASTRRALDLIGELPDQPRVLDLGCGPGRQTVVLAAETGGSVLAVDLHEPFLQQVRDNAVQAGVREQIETRCASMDALDEPAESFDLIWSEGAAYLIGFERALKLWRRFLRPGGCIGLSEASWFARVPPAEVLGFWNQAYPQMATQEVNAARAQKAGLDLVGAFRLPEEDWRNDYYDPLRERIERLRPRARSEPELAEVIEATEYEIEIFERYRDDYGYVFYLLRRPAK